MYMYIHVHVIYYILYIILLGVWEYIEATRDMVRDLEEQVKLENLMWRRLIRLCLNGVFNHCINVKKTRKTAC